MYERVHGWSQAAEEEMEVWRGFVRRVGELGLEEAIDKPLLVDVSPPCPHRFNSRSS